MDFRSGSDLRPSLTRLNAIALVAGTIIGASIFVQPSEIAQHLSKPAEIMLVWLARGVLTLFGALVGAELASAFPQTGGLYIFLRETFSPFAGFLWGWAIADDLIHDDDERGGDEDQRHRRTRAHHRSA